MAAAFWAIEEGVPFQMFSRPTFRKMFKSLNKRFDEIVNIDERGIREKIMTLGKYAEKATLEEIKYHEVAWTTDHWTGPNDKSYSTISSYAVERIFSQLKLIEDSCGESMREDMLKIRIFERNNGDLAMSMAKE